MYVIYECLSLMVFRTVCKHWLLIAVTLQLGDTKILRTSSVDVSFFLCIILYLVFKCSTDIIFRDGPFFHMDFLIRTTFRLVTKTKDNQRLKGLCDYDTCLYVSLCLLLNNYRWEAHIRNQPNTDESWWFWECESDWSRCFWWSTVGKNVKTIVLL